MKHSTFEKVARYHNQCWAHDPTGKWVLFTGLDTAIMELFVAERANWPAIPILHPDATAEEIQCNKALT